MEYKRLGESNLKVSRIGFGCWAIGGHGYGNVDDRVSKGAIRKALDLGINFFDTANVYGFGHSEMVLSNALQERRHDVIIATKIGMNWDRYGKTYRDCSPKSIVESLEKSLRRLRIDCIPLCQIHWHDGKTRIGEIMEVLEKCRRAGKIKHIGCCNFSLEQINEALGAGKLASIQALYNVKKRENEEILEECFNSLGMGVMVYEVLGRGLFSGKYNISSKFGENDTRVRDWEFREGNRKTNVQIAESLGKIGKRYEKTAPQVAIKWTLTKHFVSCALIGAKAPSQVAENVGSIGWNLKREDLMNLNSLKNE